MKVITLMKSASLAILLNCAGNVAAADTSGGCDMRIWQVNSPWESALCEQPVNFSVYNGGAAVSHFKAGVKIDGNVVYEKEFNETVESGATYTVDLDYKVKCPYGQTTVMTMFVDADGDTDPSNNEKEWKVTMPRLLDYPYEWRGDDGKDDFTYGQKWGVGWKYDDSDYHAFYQTGQHDNWIGELATLPVDFPAGKDVMCKFNYSSEGAPVRLNVVVDYGDSRDTLNTINLHENPQSFIPSFFSFTAKKQAIVRITGQLDGTWDTYGIIYLRDICFGDAKKDMATTRILSPAISQLAAGNVAVPVKVRYTNVSPANFEHPVFAYSFGDTTVRETYDGTVKSGETIDYTFKQGLMANNVGNYNMKVWCEAEGDEDKSDDELNTAIVVYTPYDFPYTTLFDYDEDSWTAVDNNGDGSEWGVVQLGDNEYAAAFANYLATFDDQYVSPAISMNKGKARVSFYYACGKASGTAHLRLYMNDVPSKDGAELLFDKYLTNNSWLNGYHFLNIDKSGNKYFIFDLEGNGDPVYIEDFNVDDDEDLCINSTKFDTKTGYNKKTAKVTISYVNHGVSPQSNIDVRYYVNDLDHYVQETVKDAVQPGDTLYYTFKKEADISKPNTSYQLIGEIATRIGSDKNDMADGDLIENLQPLELPYYYAFNDDQRNGYWQFDNGSNPMSYWYVDNDFAAYDGESELMHTNYSGDNSDDWAYSECIHMPAGKYDVSLFYRGRSYFDDPSFAQSFEVKLGTDCTPDAMNIEVGRSDNEVLCKPSYRKMANVVDIAEDGYYYVGIHSTSAANQGETHIDAVSVSPVKEGVQLPFNSDFANGSDAWTWYNENSILFTKWVAEDGKAVLDRNEDESFHFYEGLLVSPKLALTPGKKVKVEIKYSVDSDDDSVTLQMYGGNKNVPTDMEPLALLPATDSTYEYEFTPEASDTEYYLGFRSNTDIDDQDGYSYGPLYKIELSSVSVAYEDATGIDDAASAQGVTVARRNGSITVSAASGIVEASLYDATGRTIASAKGRGGSVSLGYGGYKGVAVLKATTVSGAAVVRKLTL